MCNFARFPRRQPCNTKASSPSAMFWHDALASVGCPSPLLSFCICQFRLHYTALLLQGALPCPNEMIRYDKNLEPIPMFDHRISSYIIVVHSGCFFVSSLCIPARSLGFARLFLDSSCMFLPITCPMDFASGISSLALGLVGCNLWICKGLGKVWRGLVRFTDLWYVRVLCGIF